MSIQGRKVRSRGRRSALQLLDTGKLRVAEKIEGAPGPSSWKVNQWLKKAVLLSFRLNEMALIPAGLAARPGGIRCRRSSPAGLRATCRRWIPVGAQLRGAALGLYCAGVVLMPSFVNLGAYVDSGTMVDTWVTVGSCAQIGKNVHLSGGVGIGGVLEPLQANPTIIEDDCFIGARSEIVRV